MERLPGTCRNQSKSYITKPTIVKAIINAKIISIMLLVTWCLLNSAIVNAKTQANQTFFSGTVDSQTNLKKIILIIHSSYLRSLPDEDTVQLNIPIHGRKFKCKLPNIDKLSYVSIVTGIKNIDYSHPPIFIVNPGDQIVCRVSKDSISFSNENSFSYYIQQKLFLIDKHSTTPIYYGDRASYSYFLYSVQDSLLNQKKASLDSARSKLPLKIYSELLTSMTIERNIRALDYVNRSRPVFTRHDARQLTFVNDSITSIVEKTLNGLNGKPYNYADYIYAINRNATVFTNYKDSAFYLNFPVLYKRLAAIKESGLRTQLLAIAFKEVRNQIGTSQYLDSALSDIDMNSPYSRSIASANHRFRKGASFFNFKLEDPNRRKKTLADLKGKTLIIDFWFTGCYGCAQLGKAMRSVKSRFKNNDNIRFVSISIDEDRNTWLQSLKSNIYNSPEDTNLYTNGLGEEAPIIKYYGFNSFPQLFIVSKSGKIYDGSPQRPAGPEATEDFIETINKCLEEDKR